MAQRAMGDIQRSITGVQRQLAIQFAPAIAFVAEKFGEWMKTARPMGEIIESIFKTGVDVLRLWFVLVIRRQHRRSPATSVAPRHS